MVIAFFDVLTKSKSKKVQLFYSAPED